MDVERAYAQANALLRAGWQESARKLLVDLVAAQSDHVDAWLLLATVVDVDQSIDCLKRVLALDPDNQPARQWLPRALREQARRAGRLPDDQPGVDPTEPGDDQGPVPPLGQYLLDFKFVQAEQLKAALAAQRHARERGEARRLGELLLEQGAITEDRLNFAVREQRRVLFSQLHG